MPPSTRDEILPPDRSCAPPSAFWFSRIARYAPSHCKAKFEAHLRPWLLTFFVGLGLSQESYCGDWDSEEDFARHIIKECCNLELKIAEYLLHKLYMKKQMIVASPITSTMKRSCCASDKLITDASCSGGTTRWERTVTCSADSDPQTTPKNGLLARSSLAELKAPKGKALFV